MSVKSDVARLEKVTKDLGKAEAFCECSFSHEQAVRELLGEASGETCERCGKPFAIPIVLEDTGPTFLVQRQEDGLIEWRGELLTLEELDALPESRTFFVVCRPEAGKDGQDVSR